METIDRFKAEELIEKYSVDCTDLKHDNNEITIMFKFTNGKRLIVKYNLQYKKKKFYID